MTPRFRPRLLFVWEKFGPYHRDRCEACAAALGEQYDIAGIEVSGVSKEHFWDTADSATRFRTTVLIPGADLREVPRRRYFRALLAACLASGARHVFLCGYEMPHVFWAAVFLRLLGRHLVVLQDSKFDDKPRRLRFELAKSLLYRPYHAAFVGSSRSAGYLEFLGFPKDRIFLGYDTLSLARLARLAGAAPAPEGAPHGERHFTIIARFAPEKNLAMAIEAYAAYCAKAGASARELHLCGAGPLESELREQAARLGLERVRFRGYLQEEAIAKTLAQTLALILPSVSEPFGLVVNEAIALGVPVIVAENCGARDLLLRQAVNGYLIEPDNPEGLAHWLHRLDADREEWSRLARNTQRFRVAADTAAFVAGVERILDALTPERRRRHFPRSLKPAARP